MDRVTSGIDFVNHTTRVKPTPTIVKVVLFFTIVALSQIPLFWFGLFPGW